MVLRLVRKFNLGLSNPQNPPHKPWKDFTMPRKKNLPRNGKTFFTKQQFQQIGSNIEEGSFERDGETIAIRFKAVPFSEHKKLAGLTEDNLNEERLDQMLAMIQRSVVTEDGETMFTIEELGELPGPLVNDIGACVLGVGKND